MDMENSEILRELEDTIPDTSIAVTDDIPTNLSTDLDTELEKFGVPNDGFDPPETMYGCEDTVVESLEGGGDRLGSTEDLIRDATETEESVKALLEQEKGDVQLSPDEFTEPLPDGQMQISQEPNGMSNNQQECSGCNSKISDRFLLKALNQYWHEDCLKCSCCDCRLGEMGSTLFAKDNQLLCKRDYFRMYGRPGYCSVCSETIPAFEMVMRAKSNVYHLECFACQMCNHRFCVGDRFYLCDNKILCEYDYEERMVFANMTYNYNALSQIKRQANSLSDDLSSGYGSPSPGSL